MKRNYLLSVIVMGLIVLSLYSTYAMFTETIETDEIINMNASVLPLELKIVEYERLEINSQDKKVIEFTVNNDTNNALYYGVWYEMVNPSILNDDIVIGKKEDTLNDTKGQLMQGENAKVTFVIENKTSSTITINIGVGYSSDNNLNLPTNRYLITEVYKEGVLASDYIESLLVDNPTTMNNDDPDGNVRYMGSNPNNYVWFNNELWRIIGVFDVASTYGGPAEKRIKIIRNESLGNLYWDSNNINDWSKSSLMSYLNNEYLTSIVSPFNGMIENTLWNLGGITSSGTILSVETVFLKERSAEVYLTNSQYWIGNIGLMYLSDYGYATSGGGTMNRNSCIENLFDWYNFSYCYVNNYLNVVNLTQWTLTNENSYNNNVYHVTSPGSWDYRIARSKYGVFPALYLNSTVQITGGTGTSTDPYTLSL